MIRAAVAAVIALAAVAVSAATGPVAPQAGLNAGVSVAHADGLFIDAFGYARYVFNSNPAELSVPTYTAAEWQSFRQAAVPNTTQLVACPPTTVTLCSGSAGGAHSVALSTPTTGPGATYSGNPNGYGVVGQTSTASATCTDAWGLTYGDSVTATCNSTGSGAAAVGTWTDGSDMESCSANAHTSVSGCSAPCGPGTTTTTVYDSCGNVTGSSSAGCNLGSCCTPSYSKSCSTSTAIYTDVKCGTGSYTVPNGCTAVQTVTGETACIPGYRTTTSGGWTYHDCGSSWCMYPGMCWGGGTCTADGWDYEWDQGPGGIQTYVNAGVDHTTCTGTVWQ